MTKITNNNNLVMSTLLRWSKFEQRIKKGEIMEAMGILGFVFGLIAFVRIEKLIKTLKEKRVLEENYKEE